MNMSRNILKKILGSGFLSLLFVSFLPSISFSAAVELSADNGLEWNLNKRTIVAKENAILTKGEMNIISDNIAAYYKEVGNKREIYEITAMGNVNINSLNYKIISDYLTYDMRNSILTLSMDGNGEVVMESDDSVLKSKGDVVFYQNKNKIILQDARVENSGKIISGDTLYVFLESGKGKNSSSELKRIIVNDGVKIIDGDQVIIGDKADFNQKTGIANITGNVSFEKGSNVSLSGGKVTYNMRTGVAKILPSKDNKKVKGVFSN